MELRQQLVHEVAQVGGVPKKLESIGSPGRKWQIGTPPERSISSCFWLVFPVIFGFVVKQGGFFISLPNHYPSHPIFRQSYPIQSIFLGFRKIW